MLNFRGVKFIINKWVLIRINGCYLAGLSYFYTICLSVQFGHSIRIYSVRETLAG